MQYGVDLQRNRKAVYRGAGRGHRFRDLRLAARPLMPGGKAAELQEFLRLLGVPPVAFGVRRIRGS